MVTRPSLAVTQQVVTWVLLYCRSEKVYRQAVAFVAIVHLALAVNDIGQAAHCLDMPMGTLHFHELGQLPSCDHWDDMLLVSWISGTGDLVCLDSAFH